MIFCVDEIEIRDFELLNGINSMLYRYKYYILVIFFVLLLKFRYMEIMIF